MAWTDQMVEDLREMWKQGLTTAEIGKKLGVSKNSIVGKVHRLGLSGRPSPIKKKDTSAETEGKSVAPKDKVTKSEKESAKNVDASVKDKVKEAKSVQPSTEKNVEKVDAELKEIKDAPKVEPEVKECFKSDLEKSAKAVSLMELDNHTCRWPLGDPKDENFRFCGKKVRIGQTYCEEHAAVAYVKPGKSK